MSYDRVLPNPASLRHESAPVSMLPRPSDLLDHKIMNDHLPKSYMALPHRPGPGGMSSISENARYTPASQMRPTVAQTHQHVASYGRARGAMQNDSAISPVLQHAKLGPMVTTTDLARDRSASSSGSSSPTKSAKSEGLQFCLCQPDPKIPRPRNAFILYRQHWQSIVVRKNPGMANPEISKVIGEQWRQLSEEEKNEWKALAEEEKIRHAQQYPDYRYQPRRVGRDGSSRNTVSGISHNPTGKSTCNQCGGRVMNAPSTPMTPFTPKASQGHRESFSGPPSRPHIVTTTTVRTASSSQCRDKADRAPKPIRIDQMERPRHRQMEEDNVMSPETKRRRLSHTSLKPPMQIHQDRSPESACPSTPYSAPANIHQSRTMLPGIHSQRAYGGAPVPSQPQIQSQGQTLAIPDPSLKLPPLQTAIPSTPLTPFSTADSSVETAVMTIPFLNKIKLLSKISPPLVPSFRDDPSRGPVIAVDGQDPELVRTAVEYLHRLLQKEKKFSVRVFDGPDIQTPGSSDGGPMGDATVDYLNTISAWHRISDEIIGFVKSVSTPQSPGTDTPINTNISADTNDQDHTRTRATPDGSASPRAIIPKTATLNLHSPKSTSTDSETSSTTPSTTASTLAQPPAPTPTAGSTPTQTPVALVPRYQLTTADTFACNIPINDSYAPLDHWQWMASLWRACVGPDITVYVRECLREEVERVGAVEIRLADFRTVVLRKSFGVAGMEEKVLRRMGFEVEDFLTS